MDPEIQKAWKEVMKNPSGRICSRQQSFLPDDEDKGSGGKIKKKRKLKHSAIPSFVLFESIEKNKPVSSLDYAYFVTHGGLLLVNQVALSYKTCPPIDPKVPPLYGFIDACHLLKSFRNGWITHKKITISDEFVQKFNLPTNVAHLDSVKKLVEFDKDRELKIAPHLADENLFNLNTFEKMDVAKAKKILCKRTANGLHFLIENGHLPEEEMTTVKLIEVMSHCIDLLTSRDTSLYFSCNQK